MRIGDVVRFKSEKDAGDLDIRMIIIEKPDCNRVRVLVINDMNIKIQQIFNTRDLEICEFL